MKHIISILTLFCLTFVGGGLVGCSDDPTPTPIPEEKPSAVLSSDAIVGISTAELKLTTNKIPEYAYLLSSEATATTPSAAIIFGTGTTVKATDGENTISLKGLEGNTDYTLFVATKIDDKFGEEILSAKFHTAKYTEFITILDTGYKSIRFHIEIQPGDTIGWGVSDRDRYLGLKEQFGYLDANFIGGSLTVVQTLAESQTVEFTGWNEQNGETGEIIPSYPNPGQALTLLAGKINRGIDPNSGEEAWIAEFDFDKYYDSMNGGGGGELLNKRPHQGPPTPMLSEDECWKTPYHAAIACATKAPDKLDAHVKVAVVKHTTRSITLNFTPDNAIKEFGWSWVDMATWNAVEQRLGSVESTHTWMYMGGMPHSDVPVEVTVPDLEPGITYRMLILGYIDAEHLVQSVDYYDFKAADPSKPAPKMSVTGISAPEGETESPWKIWFNVKCTSQDAVGAKYLCNTVREWVMEMNGSGVTYSQMMEAYGNELTQDEVNKINSNEGLNLVFDSWEDSESRLVVSCFNDEQTASNPDADKGCIGDMRSICIPDAPRVDSPLFTDLTGDWTATIRRWMRVWDQSTGDASWELDNEPIKVKVVVSDEPAYPATCPEAAYAVYEGKTRDEVDKLYADFKKVAEKYKGKVRGQNRLVCQGFDVNPESTGRYMSPVDLFGNANYSAYSSDDLFHDFGPKWYLQIAADGSITIPVDLKTIAPMTAWSYSPYYLIGMSDKYYAVDLTEFKTTVSADKQTIEILPAVIPTQVKGSEEMVDVTYYPSVSTVDKWGGAQPAAKCQSIVLTKGWTEQPASSMRSKRQVAGKSFTIPGTRPFSITPTHHKTRLGKVANAGVVYKAVTTPRMFYTPGANAAKMAKRYR
ncbi:MAG: hypothetical protein RR298_01790 [Alistipes sp.]